MVYTLGSYSKEGTMDRKSKDRNAQQPNNGQMMTELKYLKATLAAKDKRIKELEELVKKLTPAPAPAAAPVVATTVP